MSQESLNIPLTNGLTVASGQSFSKKEIKLQIFEFLNHHITDTACNLGLFYCGWHAKCGSWCLNTSKNKETHK